MRIGVAGPISLRLLRGLENSEDLPVGYEHPPMSELVNGFLDREHNVTVFTSSVGLQEPVVRRAGKLTVCIARRQTRAARELFRSVRKELVALMNEHPTDIINAHWTYEFAWASLDSGIPTLVTLRDHAATVFRYHRTAYWFMRLMMNLYVLRRAEFLSTNSIYLYNKLTSRQRSKARIIENFFADTLLDVRTPLASRDDHIICVANGFRRLKNIKAAIYAFRSIRSKHPSMKLKLVGYEMGPGEAAEVYATEAGAAEGVDFLGRLPHGETLAILRTARLMLHPSLEESFGMGVLEAMVVGTPVVGGVRSGHIPVLLDGGKAGVLCNVRKPQAIAEAMLGILEDGELAQQLAEAAYERATSHYSQDAAMERYLEYFQEIIQCKRADRH